MPSYFLEHFPDGKIRMSLSDANISLIWAGRFLDWPPTLLIGMLIGARAFRYIRKSLTMSLTSLPSLSEMMLIRATPSAPPRGWLEAKVSFVPSGATTFSSPSTSMLTSRYSRHLVQNSVPMNPLVRKVLMKSRWNILSSARMTKPGSSLPNFSLAMVPMLIARSGRFFILFGFQSMQI